jgi:hypothetical protein
MMPTMYMAVKMRSTMSSRRATGTLIIDQRDMTMATVRVWI